MDLGHQTLILITYSLFIARLTKLVNSDMVLDRFRVIPFHKLELAKEIVAEATRMGRHAEAVKRGAAVRRWADVVYFVQCPWCVGFWLSLATAAVPVLLIGWPWWATIPVAFAVSHLVGVFAFAAHTEETEVVKDKA